MQAHLKWREENGIDAILTDFHFDVSAPRSGRTPLLQPAFPTPH